MEFLGADTEQVMGHARALRDCDERITALHEALGPAIARATWTGPDADAFREAWQACGERIVEVTGMLGSGAEHMAREAA
ncbi:hypothetical protein [Brachybacterium sp. GU-2]|uniref:hypothetical protein n=1 Tax=Brachybacterium sp. GU-2 TaxID=3069708 RepID=UPI00298CC8E4|nr:hypothetical protein [Brachybacterium sp. GU-2]WME21660.2 hypothetical protein RBL05_08810 [Brachybacterium sp. GU-2]